MKDYIDIGPTPPGEDCEQLGPNYDGAKARRECNAYIAQLRRTFGDEPDGARLSVKRHNHDFGEYIDVVCHYDDEKPASMDYAYKCEGDGPENWDNAALVTLGRRDGKMSESEE